MRNLINNKNVSKNPKSNFNACDDFLETVITAHILQAALHVLGMSDVDGIPDEKVISSPDTLWACSNEERKETLIKVSKMVLNKFCDFSFNSHQKSTGDLIHDYAKNFLSIGLFYLNYKDAIKEGDGCRVMDCWRYLLPLFHNAGRKNYCFEAFNLLCQYQYDLPPLQAEQLKWSRFVNVHGVRGRNIPLDLHQEYLNRLLKDMIKNFGANKRDEAIVRSSKALGTLQNMLYQFDKENHNQAPTGAHSKPSYKNELNSIINELKKHQVFDIIPQRKHESFPKPSNLLHIKPKNSMVEWLITHTKKRYYN